MCLWLCLLCVNVRAFAASVPSSSSPSSPTARNTKAFIIIFDITLRPTRTTGEHTAPSCPPNNQNCLKHHYFIFTRIYMSLSVNQAEAPSHIKVVCCGHGAPNTGRQHKPKPILLEDSQGFLFVLAFPRALACVSQCSQVSYLCHAMLSLQ